MATKVTLPQFGNTMEEGTIVKCLVKVGDKVSRGDVLFEIETDKATIEMESPDDGFVKAILAEAGRIIPVHEPVLILGAQDELVPDEYISTVKPAASLEAAESIAVPEPGPAATGADIAAAAAGAQAGDYRLGQAVPLSRLQKITARRMLQSKQQIPCFYLTARVDMTELVKRREQINSCSDANVSYNDFIIRAAATGLEHFGIMTGQVEGETIKLADSIDIGLAMSVPGGLVAPSVKDASHKSLLQIAGDTQELTERARSNKLTPDDLSGGCITISNLGSFGVESFIAVPLPGQCSILGIGEIIDTPVPDNGRIVIRKLMSVTISVDHRVANGSYAGQFLDYLRKLLQDPASLG